MLPVATIPPPFKAVVRAPAWTFKSIGPLAASIAVPDPVPAGPLLVMFRFPVAVFSAILPAPELCTATLAVPEFPITFVFAPLVVEIVSRCEAIFWVPILPDELANEAARISAFGVETAKSTFPPTFTVSPFAESPT